MPLMTKKQYIESLKKLNLKVYMFGESVNNITANPIIKPSMNSVALTYDLALASKIAPQTPISVASVKSAVNKGINVDIDTACLVETEFFARCFETQDQKNVMDAFIKKEKFTKFKNR
jgi:enoyl-CoA hydratase/carnithine racemase